MTTKGNGTSPPTLYAIALLLYSSSILLPDNNSINILWKYDVSYCTILYGNNSVNGNDILTCLNLHRFLKASNTQTILFWRSKMYLTILNGFNTNRLKTFQLKNRRNANFKVNSSKWRFQVSVLPTQFRKSNHKFVIHHITVSSNMEHLIEMVSFYYQIWVFFISSVLGMSNVPHTPTCRAFFLIQHGKSGSAATNIGTPNGSNPQKRIQYRTLISSNRFFVVTWLWITATSMWVTTRNVWKGTI